jgi:hypothetical protein
MSAISPIYSWDTPEGTLNLLPAKKGYAFCLMISDQTRVFIPATPNHNRLFSEAQKVESVCEQYFPTLNQNHQGEWTVSFELSGFLVSEDSMQNKSLGMSSFSFNELSNIRLIKFAKTGPHYHRVYPGLNIEGECDNEDCEAKKNHEGIIYIKGGMESFNIGELKRESCCPNCNQKISAAKINNLVFWDCNYKISGYRADNDTIVKRNEVAEKARATTFEPGEDCAWEYLQITTTPSAASSSPKPSAAAPAASSKFCAIL